MTLCETAGLEGPEAGAKTSPQTHEVRLGGQPRERRGRSLVVGEQAVRALPSLDSIRGPQEARYFSNTFRYEQSDALAKQITQRLTRTT